MILLLFVAANLLNYLDRYILAAVLNPIGVDLSLNDAELGRLALMFLTVYLISAPIFSYLAERHSRVKLVAIGILLWSLATSAAAFAVDFKTLLLTRALVGIGEAAYATLGPAILADLYPEKSRARIFTWFYLAIPVGSALGYTLGGAIEGLAGWRASFFVAGLPGIFLSFMFWRMKEPKLGAQDSEPLALSDGRNYLQKIGLLFKNRIWLACTGSYIAYTFAMGALSHWAPTLFQRLYQQTPASAGTLFGAIAVVTGIIGTLLGGYITDRWQDRIPNIGLWLSTLTMLAAAPVMMIGLRESNMNVAYALWAIAMLLLFINTSPVNALTVSCVPAPLRASAMAVNIFLIHLLGDAISPEIVGRRSMAGGSSGEALAEALIISVPAIILSGLILLFALRRREAQKA